MPQKPRPPPHPGTTAFYEGDIVSTKDNYGPRRYSEKVQVVGRAMIGGKIIDDAIVVQGLPYEAHELKLVKRSGGACEALLPLDWVQLNDGWYELNAISETTMLLSPIGGGMTFVRSTSEIISRHRRPHIRAKIQARIECAQKEMKQSQLTELATLQRSSPWMRLLCWLRSSLKS